MQNSYYIVVCSYGDVHLGRHTSKDDVEAEARQYVGDNGFAHIYTTDRSVEDRDPYVGSTDYFNNDLECREAIVKDFPYKAWVLKLL